MRIDWILGQILFWVLVVAIILTGVAGIRRSGAVLTVHQAGLVGGRTTLGVEEQGRQQAGSDLATWWGIDPQQAHLVVEVEEDAARRSVWVRVRGRLQTLFGNSADLGADSFQRREEFYPGPPAEWE